MLSECYYTFLKMTIVVKSHNVKLLEKIDCILCDIKTACPKEVIGEIMGEYHDGKYVFVDGNKMLIKTSDVDSAILTITSEIINKFVHRTKGHLFLHAGAVQKNGQVLLIVGKSKSGKTSLISNLINRYNYTYLSDEIVPIDLDSGSVIPFRRSLSLRKATLASLNLLPDAGNDFMSIDNEIVRFVSYKCLRMCKNEEITNNKISAIVFPTFGSKFICNEVQMKFALSAMLCSTVNFQRVVVQGLDFVINMLANVKSYELVIDDLEYAVSSISTLCD